MTYYCYYIISGNNSYIGITNNLENRLLCHNGKNGAKATKIMKTKEWSYHTVVGLFKNRRDASRFEWYWKFKPITKKIKTNKKSRLLKWRRTGSGVNNKMNRLLELLMDDEWNHITIQYS